MAKPRKYTDEQFIEAVKESFSVRECLNKLNLRQTGGNYKQFKNRVKILNLDISHFTGQGHLKGKQNIWHIKTELKDILVIDSTFQSHKLKIRLIKEGLKIYKCECCGNTEWMGNKIPLELDHINGINTDNRIENLKLLCPNCHALTDTYRGKNKKSD